VQVAGDPAGEVFDRLKEGYYFTEGKFRVRDIRRLGRQGQSTILQIILTEGQNREVRRLLARVGHKVLNLKRIAFGPLKLADLETGAYRKLNGVEVAELHRMAEGRPARKFTRPPGARPKVAKKSSAHIRSVKAAAAERGPGSAVGTARPATKRPMRPETSAGRPATSKPAVSKPAAAKKKVARGRPDRPAPRGTKGSAKGGGRSR
jgi:23S rRNA pseudouridine2605 synthase